MTELTEFLNKARVELIIQRAELRTAIAHATKDEIFGLPLKVETLGICSKAGAELQRLEVVAMALAEILVANVATKHLSVFASEEITQPEWLRICGL